MQTKSQKNKKDSIIVRTILLIYNWFFRKQSIAKQFLIWYLLLTLFGGLLLYMPFSQTSNEYSISFIDAIFVSASAISDCGLTTMPISSTFNFFGQLIIMFLLILGGIGLFALKIFIINFFFFTRFKLKYKSVQEAKERLGNIETNHSLGIIRVAVISTISLILIFGPIFGIFFATVDPSLPPGASLALQNNTLWYGSIDSSTGLPMYVVDPSEISPGLKGNWSQSMWNGFFIVASSVNNAGFDVLNGSMSLMGYYGNYGFQAVIMFLFIFGGIGFTLIYDLKEYFRFKAAGKRFRFSLYTKLALISYLAIAFIGVGLVFLVEGLNMHYNASSAFLSADNGYGSLGQRVWAIFFNTFATRNAGFSTISFLELNYGSWFIYVILMFIGSGPGSTAGGIRTTTITILVIAMWSYMRGKKESIVFDRKISQNQINDSFMITFFSLILVIFTTITLMFTEVNLLNDGLSGPETHQTVEIIDFLFLMTSAFGTTGLATFDLESLAVFSKLVVIVMMFVGQLGVGTTLKQFRSKKISQKPSYHIEETISIG